jgi:hypothetical protein
MGDINNAFETLERSLKKIGIVLIDEQEDIKNGKPSQVIALTRKVLLSTSTAVAKQMLLKGCPSHATDKKLAIAAFDVLRDSKLAPNISIDQFFSQVMTSSVFRDRYFSNFSFFLRVLFITS